MISFLLYDFISMTFWKRQNSKRGKHISGCQRLGVRRGCDGQYQGSLGAKKTLLFPDCSDGHKTLHLLKLTEHTFKK